MIRISSEITHYGFSPKYDPIVSVKSGDDLLIECTYSTRKISIRQLRRQRVSTRVDWSKVNPVTGPVFVEGAMPGDVLKVEIGKVTLDKFGIYSVTPHVGILGDLVTAPSRKIVMVSNGRVRFRRDISAPLSPNIGTIGVSPRQGLIPSGYPGDHGGNMDTREIRSRATLYLPVFAAGALFSIGDLHICMGDGEICGSGGATSGRVRLTLSIIKHKPLRRPLLNAEGNWYTIASGRTLDEAVRFSTEDMLTLLRKSLGMSFNDAYIIASALCNVKVNQAVNPLKTARVVAPHWLLDEKQLF